MSANATTVYTGQWTDHTRGKYTGHVVTLTTQHSTFLVAFIVLFDSCVGSVFWNALALLLFQYRARTNRPRDGLWHQTQALLRSSNEPFSFTQNVIYCGQRWRGRAARPLLRTLPLAVLATMSWVFFSVAGILSARIAAPGTVLLTGTNCGQFNQFNLSTDAEATFFGLIIDDQIKFLSKESTEYAQTCYPSPTPNTTLSLVAAEQFSPGASCSLYVKPALPWSTTEVDCPFADPTVCSVPKAIQLDTGYLSTLHDLGINVNPSDDVLFRIVETCSPLTTTGFSNNSFTESNLTGLFSDIAIYSYGANGADLWVTTGAQAEMMENWYSSNNVTFVYPEAAMSLGSSVPYWLDSASITEGPANVSERFFFPDSRISPDDNLPVSLFFLGNRAMYLGGPVEDAWFKATTPGQALGFGDPILTYQSTTPGAMLGCVDHVQVCNPNAPGGMRCSNLNTTWLATDTTTAFWSGEDLGFNPTQSVNALSVAVVATDFNFGGLAGQNSQDLLLASTFVALGVTATLPSNHWQIEMQHWMAISLASIQRMFLYGVTGPTIPEVVPYWSLQSSQDAIAINGLEATEINRKLCAAQMIRTAAYQSFSVLGICINLIVGGLIILIGLVVRYAVPYFQGRSRQRRSAEGKEYSDIPGQAWFVNGVLQLQRTAFEHSGLGDWYDDKETIPVTKSGKDMFRWPTRTVFQAHPGESTELDYLNRPLEGTDHEHDLPYKGGLEVQQVPTSSSDCGGSLIQ